MSGEIRSCGGRVEDAPMIPLRGRLFGGRFPAERPNLAMFLPRVVIWKEA